MSARAIRNEDVLEDLYFLADTGVGAVEAAPRAGFSSVLALEKWMYRHAQRDLYQRLRANDPEGAHHELKQRKKSPMSDRIQHIIDQASQSPRGATRRKAERARRLVEELEATLKSEQAEAEQRAAAQAEVDRLTAELAEAKTRLRGGQTTATSGPTPADLRAFAAARGIPCPARGRVPRVVREAYEAESEEST